MLFKLFIALVLTLYAGPCFSTDNQSDRWSSLHQASADIDQHADHELISNSLYEQIQPRANITDKELSQDAIDTRVRKYVSEKYAPVLIANYSKIYSELRNSNKDFSSCDPPVSIQEDVDILKTLCLKQEKSLSKIHYMTNAYSQGWSITAVFVFNHGEKATELVAIELQLAEDTKFYVEGI